ncbi:phosphoribosylpyrophosphate synthetase [Flavobacterium tistrianum]|uniref:phosphoribosylpyrophosphate synthetase n=1 Tax=Flavobacterium tistrianum TaxID=1685414 RepID=UPI000DACD560|nr:phosphoribosylpyrophosphate synthetase [Flavobacterium tistrianum]KAF2338405.1 phosphoribosylpyrophosphate synthetase [Flavobacterium tistrianum]
MSSLQQPYFETVTEALQWLNGQGFTENFNLDSDCIRCSTNPLRMSPEEFKIEYLFRFEGDTDPGDEDIVYGIISDIYNVKGVLTSAFGIYADSVSAEMIKKLSTH